jgi:SAM-dependent methyltransferase
VSGVGAGSFEELVVEAERAPADAWDFSWLAGRAEEDRPSWGYFDRVAERAPNATRLLDVQCGTGRMLADLPALPPTAVGIDGWPPSVAVAARSLGGRGAYLLAASNDTGELPLRSDAFDLVISRHPVRVWWDEIARVLSRGGSYYAQHVGPHSMRDLAEALRGPLPDDSARDPEVERRGAEAAGLVVDELRYERPEVVFYDIGAIVYFLRLVVWTVPDFSVSRYEQELRALHDHIRAEGCFRTTSSRLLVDATLP